MRCLPLSHKLLTLALCACAASCWTTSNSETAAQASSAATQAAAPTPSAPTAAPAPARVILTPAGQASGAIEVDVEVVQTPEARQLGLMHRKYLAPKAGMWFIFERPQQLTFWMRNTLLPLDMIFVTSDFQVLGVVENATPLTDSPRSVPGNAQYVLEVNAGFARRNGIVAGASARYVPAQSGS
jgi:uncharacterized membrane protein (UPF0127 family)